MSRFFLLISLLISIFITLPAFADHRNDPVEQAVSDALDLWREGSFERLYDVLSRRNGMTRESFVEKMKDGSARPACCHQKLADFRIVSSKRTTARVYARIGFDGVAPATKTRELTLDYEEGVWKMRLADIRTLAGLSKTRKHRSVKARKYNN